MSEKIKASVIIPCHNHEQWVGKAIESVLAQTHQNKRIVVVDDGSTDNSARVVTDYITTDSMQVSALQFPYWFSGQTACGVSICLLRFNQPSGPSFARNVGIQESPGADVFFFLDSDDLYAPTKIERSINKWLQDKENIGAVYSDYDTLNANGLRLRQYKQPFSREVLLGECIVNCDSMVSAAALKKVGAFDEQLRVCEDYDLWLRISEHFLIAHIPESLVTVRVGEHSSTSQVAKERWNWCYSRVFDKLKTRQGQVNA